MTQTPVLPPEIPDQNHDSNRDSGKVRAESPGPSPTSNPIATVSNENRSAATVADVALRPSPKPSKAEAKPSHAGAKLDQYDRKPNQGELKSSNPDSNLLTPPEIHAKFGIVSSLHIALRAKYGPSASHSLRVAMRASAWGMAYGIREEQLQLLELTGLLHEIGKIGIPDRVLQKSDKLNTHEQSMMDLHPHVGVEIVRAAGGSETLQRALSGIGRKYSDLQSSELSEVATMASCLVNIIDAYDSMTTRSVYREPLAPTAAITELVRCSGMQFDPRLTASFAELILRPRPELDDKVRKRWANNMPAQAQLLHFQASATPEVQSVYTAQTSALDYTLSDSFYRHMLNNMQQGVIFIDTEFRILQWNKAAERMTGQPANAVLQQFWVPAIAGLRDKDGFKIADENCPFLELITTGERCERRYSIKMPDSNLLHLKLELVPVHNEQGILSGGAMLLEDISETAALEEKIATLHQRACQDPLTKVCNRGELNRQLPEFVKQHIDGQPQGAIIICDIDFFKRINDNFSHQAGDTALKMFAQLLKESCRSTDLVARYGGEEFVMLCPNCDLKEATDLAESIRGKLSRMPIPELRNSCITASFGVTVVQVGDTDESSLGRADRCLIMAKESGRDRVVAIGLEELKNKDYQTFSQPTSWLDWVGLSTNKIKLEAELVSNVTKDVTLEKLRGFIEEFQGKVSHVELNQAIFDIDCKNTPLTRQSDQRLGKHRIQVKLTELEMKAGSEKNQIKLATHIHVMITPVSNRDRREDVVMNQCARLMQALQCFLLAQIFDERDRADVIRTVKPVRDTRY